MRGFAQVTCDAKTPILDVILMVLSQQYLPHLGQDSYYELV